MQIRTKMYKGNSRLTAPFWMVRLDIAISQDNAILVHLFVFTGAWIGVDCYVKVQLHISGLTVPTCGPPPHSPLLIYCYCLYINISSCPHDKFKKYFCRKQIITAKTFSASYFLKRSLILCLSVTILLCHLFWYGAKRKMGY